MTLRRTLLSALLCAAIAAAADPPKRIVSLSPNLTEILYGVGAFGQVVGVSDYCTYPPEVTKLPSVGGWHNPSLEKLIAMRPDLVIVDDGQATFVEDKFRQLGLNVVVVKNQTVQEIFGAIMQIGAATGHAAEAAKLVESTRQGLARVAAKTARLPKIPVVLIVDRTLGTLRDLYAATDNSFLAELVSIAGGKIATKAVSRGYAKISKEDLLAANPEVILEFVQGIATRFSGDPLEAWREMPELRAVRNKRIHEVAEDFVPHASQRIVQTAELFARLIHPEAK